MGERYTYSAYGTVTVRNEDFSVKSGGTSYVWTILFAGEDVDKVTGLSYNDNRWYVTGLGVFTATDPVESSPNEYVYVLDNPNAGTDPSGDEFSSSPTWDPNAVVTPDLQLPPLTAHTLDYWTQQPKGNGFVLPPLGSPNLQFPQTGLPDLQFPEIGPSTESIRALENYLREAGAQDLLSPYDDLTPLPPPPPFSFNPNTLPDYETPPISELYVDPSMEVPGLQLTPAPGAGPNTLQGEAEGTLNGIAGILGLKGIDGLYKGNNPPEDFRGVSPIPFSATPGSDPGTRSVPGGSVPWNFNLPGGGKGTAHVGPAIPGQDWYSPGRLPGDIRRNEAFGLQGIYDLYPSKNRDNK